MVKEPVIEILPLIPSYVYVVGLPKTTELALTELKVTSAVVATSWPIDIVCVTLELPSKPIPSSDNVIPVPALKTRGNAVDIEKTSFVSAILTDCPVSSASTN